MSRALLPRVSINMAMTADGKIATANRAMASFGSARDHAHLLELRTTADAVMAGARTVDSNPVNLGPGPRRYRRRRIEQGLSEYNLRVIVSRNATVDPGAEIFRHRFSPIIILTTDRAPTGRLEALRTRGAQVKSCGREDIDFRTALAWLRRQWNVRHLLCEGGGELNDALFRAELVDVLHLTICPLIVGGRAAPTIADGCGLERLARARNFQLRSRRRYGDELFLTLVRT